MIDDDDDFKEPDKSQKAAMGGAKKAGKGGAKKKQSTGSKKRGRKRKQILQDSGQLEN